MAETPGDGLTCKASDRTLATLGLWVLTTQGRVDPSSERQGVAHTDSCHAVFGGQTGVAEVTQPGALLVLRDR